MIHRTYVIEYRRQTDKIQNIQKIEITQKYLKILIQTILF